MGAVQVKRRRSHFKVAHLLCERISFVALKVHYLKRNSLMLSLRCRFYKHFLNGHCGSNHSRNDHFGMAILGMAILGMTIVATSILGMAILGMDIVGTV